VTSSHNCDPVTFRRARKARPWLCLQSTYCVRAHTPRTGEAIPSVSQIQIDLSASKPFASQSQECAEISVVSPTQRILQRRTFYHGIGLMLLCSLQYFGVSDLNSSCVFAWRYKGSNSSDSPSTTTSVTILGKWESGWWKCYRIVHRTE
jgi:hypothetical protein